MIDPLKIQTAMDTLTGQTTSDLKMRAAAIRRLLRQTPKGTRRRQILERQLYETLSYRKRVRATLKL